MKGIILAGGEGKRLLPLTLTIPKPLIKIRGIPLINHNLELFNRYGVHEVRIIIRSSDSEAYLVWQAENGKNFSGMDIKFEEEKEPMGTLGYVTYYLDKWIGDQMVFVTNGDDIKDIDLVAMADFHHNAKTPTTVALMKMEQPDDYGAVIVENGKIVDFLEKKAGMPPGYVSAGIYVLTPEAFTFVREEAGPDPKKLMFERDMFPQLAKNRRLGAFVCRGKFFDCGTLERWEWANREL